MRLLRAVFQSVFFGKCGWALQAHVVGRQRGHGLAFVALGCLGNNWSRVKDAPEDRLVVDNAIVHGLLRLGQEALDVLWEQES